MKKKIDIMNFLKLNLYLKKFNFYFGKLFVSYLVNNTNFSLLILSNLFKT